MTAYYNELDPKAAQWLRNLIAAGHIAPGEVDNRSILEVEPDELAPFTQCHFFAGIGVWSHALRSAGWPDDRPVWTGSCPCQPFSAAGKGDEFADERHLWPAWFRLIRERRPSAVFGEQVASKDALTWLDHVHADMEGEGYAVGAVDTCAAGFGAPHIRQRFYFVAHAAEERHERSGAAWGRRDGSEDRGATGAMAHADGRYASAEGLQRGREHGQQQEDGGVAGGLGDAHKPGSQGRIERGIGPDQLPARPPGMADDMADAERRGREEPDVSVRPARQDEAAAIERGASYWSAADWIPCADGARRPVEPGTFPLAHGAAARVVRLRAYGNAIVAPVAEEFIRAYMSLQ